MRISVVIHVYNDQDRLGLCLRALETQTLSAEDFEVTIVENGSRVPITIEAAPNTRIVGEQKPGSYAARNTGINHAAGAIPAFTDTDCVPDRTWLSAMNR